MTTTVTSGVYATLDDLKRRLAITDTDDDAQLVKFLQAASDYVTQATGRVFTKDPADVVITQDGFDALENGKLLLIPRGIVSLTKLEVAAYTGDAYVEVVAGDWFLRPSGPDLQPGWPYTELWITNVPHPQSTLPMFPAGFDTVRLTGRFGWPAIPSDIATVTLNFAVSLFRARGAGGGPTVTIDTDGVRTIEREFTSADWATLSRYRRRDVDIV